MGLLLSGRTKAKYLGMRSGRVLIAFTFWVAVCVPTQSVAYRQPADPEGQCYRAPAGCPDGCVYSDGCDSFRLMYTIGLSMGLVAIMGLVFRHGDQSRLGAEGTLSLRT